MRTITVQPIEEMTDEGRGYVATLDDGVVLATHYSSNDYFAMHDLGMYEQDATHHNSKEHALTRRTIYAAAAPEGFTVEFSTTIYNG